MADSGYFNGTKFRGIDTDAASDENPLSSVLEAQIANNHQNLHRFGGGAVTRAMGGQAAGNSYATNYSSHVSVEWASVFMQPYLVTRGLKKIIVDWVGTNEWEDEFLGVDVKLELRGIAQTVVNTWSEADFPYNGTRTIELELSAPYDDEVETELILWVRSHIDTDLDPGEYLDRVHNSTDGNGYFNIPGPPYTLTFNHFRAIKMIGSTAGFTTTTPFAYFEPLFRNRSGKDPEGNTTETVLYNRVLAFSRIVAGEIKVGGLTSRSIAIREEHA